MWARVHKLDRVRPQPGGGAIVVIEDGRTVAQMQRVPGLSTLVAIARVIGGKRALEVKFDGKGEVRYAAAATLPSFLSEAIARAGGAVSDAEGSRVIVPPQPSGLAALIDVAFSELAHHVRGSIGVQDLQAALAKVEGQRKGSKIDRDKEPEKYWVGVLELAALAGELARSKGGRWIDTRELPLPFALKFPDGGVAHPTTVAQQLIDGTDAA